MGGGPIAQLDDLRAPMSAVLQDVAVQLAELQKYKARFGELEVMQEVSDTE
jgi:adenylate cyclase